MSPTGCSLLGLAHDTEREYGMADFEKGQARWCPGCGDHSVLASVHRLMAAEGLRPESTVFVSGIGCSSRFPHYVNAYGFHGIHGRALPVATGIKLSRPELDVFVVMGDGDCASIGAGHWIHAIRYNLDMVVLMLDNAIFGLTKGQTSPTTPRDYPTTTQPYGSYLPALNPLEATLGVTNVSFVAQTAEWIPPHLYATLEAAHRHRGLAFVRILQRCPKYSDDVFVPLMRDPVRVELLEHEHGVRLPQLDMRHANRTRHDPSDLDAARRSAAADGHIRLGIFFRDERRPRYEDTRRRSSLSVREKIDRLNEELDRHAV